VRRALFPLGAALAVAALLAVVACGPSAEKLEAERVLRAIDVLRDAPSEPSAAREALVTALEREQATFPAAVRARDTCAKAYRLLIEGKALQAKVGKGLSEPGGATADVLRDFLAAESKITESAATMPQCDEAVADLRRPKASNR
jgi:hypothetical protein